MEISAGKNIAALGENERVVGRRGRFDFQNVFAVLERAADRAVHLRHATQAVGVLHARIVGEMGLPDFAVAKQVTQMFRHGQLAGMRPRLVNARIKSRRRSLQRLERHRAGDIRHAREPFRPEQRQAAHGMHRLGAVQEGKPLLGFEHDRPQPRLLQRIPARLTFALIKGIAFTDQTQ